MKKIIKKIAALLMSLCITSTMLVGISPNSFASETQNEVQSEDASLTEETVTEETEIESSTEQESEANDSIWEFEIVDEKAVITKYNGTATDVYVPSKVEKDGVEYAVSRLGDSLFENNDGLNSVTLGVGITEIGAKAFYDADNLVCILTSEELITIGDEAFYSCDSFNSIILYDAVAAIGQNAFSDCTKLTVWCNENTVAYSYVTKNNIPYEILNPNATPETYIVDGITYYIMNGEAIAKDFDESATEVTIPSSVKGYPVTKLQGTFYLCQKIKKVTLSEGLKEIGNYAFHFCKALEEVVIPNSVIKIGNYAFQYADKLTNINLPYGLTYIGYRAFEQCSELQSIIMPDTVTYVGSYAFFQCWEATEIVISSSITEILNNTFYYCSSIKSVVIPEGVKSIGTNAFFDCGSLTNVTLPEGLTTLGASAFSWCDKLVNINFPNSLTSIGSNAFKYCKSLESVSISSGVTAILSETFLGCEKLSEVILPDNLQKIEEDAFEGCFKISEIVIPTSITSIAQNVFESHIVFYVYEGSYAYDYFKNGGYLYFVYDGTNSPQYIVDGYMTYVILQDRAVALDYTEYNNANINVTIPEQIEGYPVTELRATFKGVSYLKSATLPDTIVNIGDSAFESCVYLKSVNIPDSVTNIGDRAFYGCSYLESVNLPQSLKSIGEYAFIYCGKMTSISIPTSLKTIGKYAFSDASFDVYIYNLESWLSISFEDRNANPISPKGNLYINDELITELVIPEDITTIPDYAFADFAALKSVEFKGKLTQLGKGAFMGCTGLESAIIPNNDLSAINSTFDGCTSLKNVELGEGIRNLGGYVFRNCTALTEIVIPSSVKGIYSYNFYGCSSLQNVTLSEGLTTMATEAFGKCTSLKSVVIPKSLAKPVGFPSTTILIVYKDSAAHEYVVSKKLLYYVYDGTGEPKIYTVDGITYCIMDGNAVAISADSTLTEVTIPKSVEGYPVTALRGTFASCTNLTTVVLPEGLKEIGDNAFQNCSNLNSVSIPQGVETIGSYAFYSCSKLTEIIMPDSVTSVGSDAFSYCGKLKTLKLSEGLTQIPSYMCLGCSSLESIVIPDSVTYIGRTSFSACTGLTRVKLPNSKLSIAAYAFYDCISLSQIYLPKETYSLAPEGITANTLVLVHKDTYSHTTVQKLGLIYFVLTKTENPEISYGTSISGSVSYTDGTDAEGATVEILHDDGTVKETKTTDVNGAYEFTYAEVGRYTIKVTDTDGKTASTQVSVKRMNVFDVFLAGDTSLTLKKGYIVSGRVSEVGAIVTITNLDGNVISTVESTDGTFDFENIPNGSYIITAQGANGSISVEVTVFDADISEVALIIPTTSATIWGYVEVEARDKGHHRRNWVEVTVYNSEGIAVAHQKSDKDGMYSFTNLPVGEYTIVAVTNEMRSDKKHGYDRNHTLTGYAYVDATEAIEYQAETIVLYEENDCLATIAGKVTANGETQDCEVVLRNVFRHEIAKVYTGNNGKYSFTNVRDGLYFVIATTESAGMGFTVVAVRDGKIYGETDIKVSKTDKIRNREDKFKNEVPEFNCREEALAHKERIADEKRFYDGLSEKEKKQLSKDYIERLNRYCEWIANCEYTADDGVTVEQGGLVVSGDELEGEDAITFNINVEKREKWETSTDGVHTREDFIQHEMEDACDSGEIKQYYEISMSKTVDGVEKQITSVTKDTDANGKFRITMQIPEEYRGYKHYNMIHVHHGEVVTLTDLDDNPDTITFEIDKFSTFALSATNEELASAVEDEIIPDSSNTVQNMQVIATDTNITVTWDAPEGVVKYNLYVKNEAGETIITREFAADKTSVTLSWPTELEWDKNYKVGIRAKTTKWLDTVWKDTALAVGDRIVDVKTESVGRTIQVTWQAYEGATQYYVHVYEKGAEKPFTSIKATTNSATIINSINPEVDYEVRVVATKGVSMKTADALVIDARLNVFTPNTVTERGVTPNKAAVSWDEVRGAYKYWVYLTSVESGETITRESSKAIVAFSGLAPNTTYEVKIQASVVDADGKTHYSGASEVLGTITTDSWEDIGFTAVGSENGADLSWSVPTNASGYVIYRSTNGGKSYKKLAAISDATVTSYTDANAKNGYRYAIVTQLQDDYITTKSSLIKTDAIVK